MRGTERVVKGGKVSGGEVEWERIGGNERNDMGIVNVVARWGHGYVYGGGRYHRRREKARFKKWLGSGR